jgi:hypothetical protein
LSMTLVGKIHEADLEVRPSSCTSEITAL